MKKTLEGAPEIHFLHLKVSLDGEPRVWRRLRVTNQLTLRGLHQVLEVAMGWPAAPAYEMRVGKKSYREDARARLARAVAPGDRIHYERDGKRLAIEVESWSAMLPLDARVVCLDGDGDDAFDVDGVNAVLAAMWERPPTSALN